MQSPFDQRDAQPFNWDYFEQQLKMMLLLYFDMGNQGRVQNEIIIATEITEFSEKNKQKRSVGSVAESHSGRICFLKPKSPKFYQLRLSW